MSVIDRWLKDKANKGVYRSIVDQFRVFSGCDSFEELLEVEDPRSLLLEWKDSLDVAPGSVNSYVSRVKSFYRHFDVELGRVPRVRNRVVLPHRVLTVDEIRLMVEHGDIRDKALIWVLYSSGARISSVLCLNVGRINFRSGGPVPLRFREDETKFNVAYTTFICEEGLVALKNYLVWRRKQGEDVEPTSPLFINKYHGRLKYHSSRKAMKLIVSKCGIEVEKNERLTHHSFRAAFNRNLQISGVNQYIIEKLMGHDTENTTTGRYSIGLTNEDLREAYTKATWTIDIDETVVRELEGRVDETERVLGAQTVENQRLREDQERRIARLEEQLKIQKEETIKTTEALVEQLMKRYEEQRRRDKRE